MNDHELMHRAALLAGHLDECARAAELLGLPIVAADCFAMSQQVYRQGQEAAAKLHSEQMARMVAPPPPQAKDDPDWLFREYLASRDRLIAGQTP